MRFRKINNISGWVIFAIAYIVYLMTMEPTVSFWDCGEFLSQAYRLEVGHSPGAPLFMLLGRIFSLFAWSTESIAKCINSLSSLTSAFTILFLFWSITHLARKILIKGRDEVSAQNLILVISAGIVGALAYTFSDTFWFSAVEGEVYATSSFFTACIFWAALKWEDVADKPYADRWWVLIFFMIGLSVGVHLLSLLTIPAIVMIYYFKKFTPTLKGGIIALIIGGLLLGIVQVGVIQYLPMVASWFELFFINSLHFPINSGALIAVLLFAAGIFYVLHWSKKNGKYYIYLATICLAFSVLGYSTYTAYLIRSQTAVPINVGQPNNVMSLIPYLQRAQYGSQPILYGPDFDSKVIDIKEKNPVYAVVTEDGHKKYKVVDHTPEYTFDKERVFPRVWDFNDPAHINFYRSYLGLGENESPTSADNMSFFMRYQVNWMYWRYFMWNYAGRQNDMEGQGAPHFGNWISGIKPVDKMLGKGDVDKMPVSYRTNRARNQLYFLPFLLGILGLLYHAKRNQDDAIVVGVFFFFTGLAVQLYINNTPIQPRERDYAYVSTYPFAIWIGLGVIFVADLIGRAVKKGAVAAVLASVICLLAVPVVMAQQEWDDHDRSLKTLARDHAYNMLSSCDSNAILITNGDNDTYPLWYLQEVEGFRTDVRIVNVNLLGTDWMNDQLRYKVNDAPAIPVIWEPKAYRGERLNYIPVVPSPSLNQDRYYPLTEVIKFFSNPDNQAPDGRGGQTSYIPTKNLRINIDRQAVLKSGLVSRDDSMRVPSNIDFKLAKNTATRGDMALMNIIAGQAKTGWTRPIYITSGTDFIGLGKYLQQEGLLLKFVPESPKPNIGGLRPNANVDKNIDLALNTFQFGLANTDKVYYDEKNRWIFLVYRQTYANLALNLDMIGRKADAVKVLDRFMTGVSESSLPYDILLYDNSMVSIVEAYYMADATDKARKYAKMMEQNIQAEVHFFNGLKPEAQQSGYTPLVVQQNLQTLAQLAQMAQRYNDTATGKQFEKTLNDIIPPMFRQPAQGQNQLVP